LHPRKKKIPENTLNRPFKNQNFLKKNSENDLLGVFSRRKKRFYKGANQTENFIGAKTRNDIYYRGEKHY